MLEKLFEIKNRNVIFLYIPVIIIFKVRFRSNDIDKVISRRKNPVGYPICRYTKNIVIIIQGRNKFYLIP